MLLSFYKSISGEENSTVTITDTVTNTDISTAYTTLLYNENFLLGVRVLGQSIKKFNNQSDMIVIVTGELSDSSLKTLENDGWITNVVETIQNPAKGPQPNGYPEQFSSVYTKLTIFNLTQYKKVLYLDADTILIGDCSALFECPGFCATLRHSERLNSGVMVVTPSTELYDDMLSKVEILPSYTGGDQGFLNAYFSDFSRSDLFEPGYIYPNDTEMLRLPTAYNADIGLYLLNSNKWMIPREDLKIIHFTLGPFKPWNWWTSWIIHEVKTWQKYRNELPDDINGYKNGSTYYQNIASHYMIYVPIIILTIILYKLRPFKQVYLHKQSSIITSLNMMNGGAGVGARLIVPKKFTGLSIFIGYLSLIIPLCIVLWIIPSQIHIIYGWILTYEWTLLLHFIIFGIYLNISYTMGKHPNPSCLPSAKSVIGPCPWNVTIKSSIISIILLLLCPWISTILHIKSFLGTLGITLIFSIITFVFLTHVYATLPVRWFAWGRANISGKDTLEL